MTDISKHPLLKACYEACRAIEKLGASMGHTEAVSRVSDMMRPIEALVDERDFALKARDEALDQVVVLTGALNRIIERKIQVSDNSDDCSHDKLEDIDDIATAALSNTSALAAQRKREIQREAVEKVRKCLVVWRCAFCTHELIKMPDKPFGRCPSCGRDGGAFGHHLFAVDEDGLTAILNPTEPDHAEN